jgi:hypothetical protein
MTRARLSIARGGQLDGMPNRLGARNGSTERLRAACSGGCRIHSRSLGTLAKRALRQNCPRRRWRRPAGNLDALFPQNRYYGATSLIGAFSNSLHGSPRLDGYFGEVVRPSGFAEFFWRESIADALYAPARFPSVPPGPSRARFVGSQYGVERELSLSRQLALNMGHAAMIGPRRTALQPDTTQRHSRCTLQQAGASVTGFPRLDRARTGTPRG